MKLNRKKVTTIILLISIALLGLICIQIYLLKNAYDLKLQAFNQNVNTALSNITKSLENRESLAGIMRVSINQEVDSTKGLTIYKIFSDDSLAEKNVTIHRQNFLKPNVKIEDKKIIFMLDSPQRVRLRLLDSLGQKIEDLVDEQKLAGEHEVDISDPKFSKGRFNFNFMSDSATCLITMVNGEANWFSNELHSSKDRRVYVDKVMEELSGVKRIPITDRLVPDVLDSIIAKSLDKQGIDMPYAYGVIPADKDSLYFIKPTELSEEIKNSQFRSRLFPADFFVKRNDLALYFPQSKFHLLQQTGILFFSSLIFISIIIFSFVYTIRTIFKQKNFSTLLTDFINNMTHEFKTPISTITLASESLNNKTVREDDVKLVKYGTIIHDESKRMRNQVEKILQMATLEEGDFELNITEISIHELLENAVKNMQVQIEGKKGKITKELNAELFEIKGELIHLENIIHNILDNAIKYTKENPEINILTQNINDQIQISFTDNGIGLKPEEKELVFEKYYRVPTGNVHNVKGFGLGLSYVKLMTEAHNGKVEVESTFGKGSTFKLYLPLNT